MWIKDVKNAGIYGVWRLRWNFFTKEKEKTDSIKTGEKTKIGGATRGKTRENHGMRHNQTNRVPQSKKKQNKMHEKNCMIVLKSLKTMAPSGKVIDTFWNEWYNAKRKFSKLFRASFALAAMRI